MVKSGIYITYTKTYINNPYLLTDGDLEMVLTDIYKIFEKRKRNMQGLLNNGHSLAIDKKNEIKGAVNEIDIFLKTLEHFKSQEPSQDEDFSLLDAPLEEKKGLFSKIFKP